MSLMSTSERRLWRAWLYMVVRDAILRQLLVFATALNSSKKGLSGD